METKSAADARRNFDRMEFVARVRRADAQARTTARAVGNQLDKVAENRSRSARFCRRKSLSRKSASASYFCQRYFKTARTANGNEGHLRAHRDRIRPQTDQKT